MTDDLAVIVVSHDTRDVLARCLEHVAAGPWETVVVDNASTDGSPELVRERFPGVRLIETGANLGMGAGNNAGIRATSARYVLVLNSDAWPAREGEIERLVAFADRRPRAGAIGPRIVNPDGSPQRSVRGFPTLWRLATEYFFLRKLAPSSPLVNAFYAGGFDFTTERDAEFLMGAALLLRREALDQVGLFDEDYFMFSEETDLCYRLHAAGWGVVFTPDAEFVHLGGASTRASWGRMYREQLRGHLRFLAKHDSPRTAERARRLLVLSLRLRGLLFPGARGRTYREAARWLASAPADALLQSSG